MGINKVILSGQAVSDPILTMLKSRTPSASFLIQVNERFLTNDNKVRYKHNVFTIESLGNQARAVMDKVKKGVRYNIEGYLRCENGTHKDRYIIRTFAVTKDEDEGIDMYYQGIEQALEVVRGSRDKAAAIDKLMKILYEGQNER